jgi:alanyl-tRNA synthetase
MEGDRYVEIWNVVFMQFNRDPEGKMHPLPKPSVDTGMGLERISAVMQGVTSNYDIDTFIYLRQAIQALKVDIEVKNPSVLVIADHIRASTFLLADGVMPSNEGRGYVLRRIIRRAIRHGHKLGLPNPFMPKLVQAVVDSMGEAYPALKLEQGRIEEQLKLEEEQFIRTITQGLKLLEEAFQSAQDKTLSGELVFKLYDTYGFPVDLTADAAREVGFSMDMQGFDVLMKKQRTQSQASHHFQTEFLDLPADLKATQFLGYEKTQCKGAVQALFVDNALVQAIKAPQKATIILSESPFYAESGGQIGDTGTILSKDGVFVVTDTKRKGDVILHFGQMQSGEMTCGERIEAHVDTDRRQRIRSNHTVTHLLHAALRQLLGPSVQQKGSLVNDACSRFDFSLNRALTRAEWLEVEQLVNAKIQENIIVETKLLSLEKAQAEGAMALFGEKYAEDVRVLSMGDFSKELCGGTHASATGDIGLFKILSETSIASGVRRIEFVTGQLAMETIQAQENTLLELATLLKTHPSELCTRVQQQNQQMQHLTQQLQGFEKKAIMDEARQILTKAHSAYLLLRLDQYDVKSLRLFHDALKDLRADLMFILVSVQEERLSVMVSIPKALQSQLGVASDWLNMFGVKGGGRPDFAQGGGAVPAHLDTLLTEIEVKLQAYF